MNMLKRSFAAVLVLAVILMACAVSFAEPSPSVESLSNATVTSTKTSSTYNGNTASFGSNIVVTLGGVTLKNGVDYTVSGAQTSKAAAGKYDCKVVIEGTGKYTGAVTKTITYTIDKAWQKVTAAKYSTSAKKKTLKKKGVWLSIGLKNSSGKPMVATCSKLKGVKAGVSKLFIPKGTKKGTYYVYVYAPATPNHKASSKIKITVKVK